MLLVVKTHSIFLSWKISTCTCIIYTIYHYLILNHHLHQWPTMFIFVNTFSWPDQYCKQYPRKLTGWNLKNRAISLPESPLLSSPFSEGREQIRSSVIMSYFHNVFLLGEPWSLRQGTSHDVTQASPDCWTASPMRQNMVKSCSDL